MSKKTDGDVMLASCHIIIIFSIYGHIVAIWKPDAAHIVCYIFIFINSNLLTQLSHYCFVQRY